MPHQILECFEIHAGLRHVATIDMAADEGSDIRHLHPIDVIVPLDHVVNAVFPMHGHQQKSLFIHQIILEQLKQQVGLSAAADASYHLDKSIVPLTDKFIQIHVSLNFHIMTFLSTENFCELSQFYTIGKLIPRQSSIQKI